MLLRTEDDSCSVYRNVRKHLAFGLVFSRNPKLFVEHQSQKPEDKNCVVELFEESHYSIRVATH
jgi:hypothetical protein